MLAGVFVVLCLATVVREVKGENVHVTTPSGVLRGTRVSIGDHSYIEKFYNIPYARPPLGDLRFNRPRDPEAWSGVRDATQLGSICPQESMPNSPPSLTFPMNEDCLYLNVYSPKPPADGSKLPVMVYIHGGAFDQGSGNMYDGTQLAKRGVVVVTINYRLDVLGFLCTEDGSSLGNYGLMDQIKALEWVRDSISAFNGDPNDVTIFGESAGGASVSLLILARQARGLFQKGIMESGVSLCPWAVSYPRLQPEPLSQAVELARRMECATHATNELVACLRTKDAMALLNATTDMRNSDPSIMLFRPVPETTFGHLLNVFDSDPQSLLEHGLFSNVSTIRGYNAHEAGWTIHDPEDDGITLDEFKAIMHEIVTDYLIRNPRPIRIASMESLLLDLYVNTPNITDPKELREAYIQMETDLLYAAPIMHELQWTTRYSGKPQYLYRFNYSSANRIDAAWRGALHAADVPYVFGSPIDGSPLWSLVNTWTDDDRTMSGTIMDMWTNFAKFGTPTPDSNGTKWLPWKPTSPNSLDIELHPVALAASPISPQLTSWLEAIPDLQRSPGELIG